MFVYLLNIMKPSPTYVNKCR